MTGRREDDDYQRDHDRVLKGIDFDDLGPEEVDGFDRIVAETAAKAKAKRANGPQEPPPPTNDEDAIDREERDLFHRIVEAPILMLPRMRR